jgi:hypothetical protein
MRRSPEDASLNPVFRPRTRRPGDSRPGGGRGGWIPPTHAKTRPCNTASLARGLPALGLWCDHQDRTADFKPCPRSPAALQQSGRECPHDGDIIPAAACHNDASEATAHALSGKKPLPRDNRLPAHPPPMGAMARFSPRLILGILKCKYCSGAADGARPTWNRTVIPPSPARRLLEDSTCGESIVPVAGASRPGAQWNCLRGPNSAPPQGSC